MRIRIIITVLIYSLPISVLGQEDCKDGAPGNGCIRRLSGIPLYISDKNLFYPPLLRSSQFSDIKDEMTFGEVLKKLGPGFLHPLESVGYIHWNFDDGKIISYRLSSEDNINFKIKLLPRAVNSNEFFIGASDNNPADSKSGQEPSRESP